MVKTLVAVLLMTGAAASGLPEDAIVWEAEAAAETSLVPGVSLLAGARAGAVLRLWTDEPGRYSARYRVELPAAGVYELWVCGGNLTGPWAPAFFLVVDDGAAAPLRVSGSGAAWRPAGTLELDAGECTLILSAATPGRNGLFNAMLDALALVPVNPPELLFRASFDEGLQPDAGSGDPALRGEAPLRPGRFGRAVHIAEGTVLEYPTQGNLDPASGAVSVWFRFLQPLVGRTYWDRIWDVTYGTDNDNAMRILLSKGGGGLYTVLSSTADGTRRRHLPGASVAVEAERWHHAVLTWGPAGTSFWLDGRQRGRGATYGPPAGMPERFTVGNVSGGGAAARALIDELRIYAGELEEPDVLRLWRGD
jgi:hypothetical protein